MGNKGGGEGENRSIGLLGLWGIPLHEGAAAGTLGT